MKKHILVVSQYFYPEAFRINDLCSEWIKRGYSVTVLTGIPNYPQGRFYGGYGLLKKRREMLNGVDIIRIPHFPRGNSSIGLFLNYVSFPVAGFFWNIFSRIKADFVFVYQVSPMTMALPAVWYSRKQKVPLYMYIMDLWPESVKYAGGVRNKYVLSLIGKMVDYIYQNSQKILVSSKGFINEIELRQVPSEKLSYWPQYAEEFYKPVRASDVSMHEIPQDGIFNILFAGNIGVTQGLDILPKTAEIIRQRKKHIRFNIVGDGRYKDTLVKLVKEYNVCDMFNFIDKQPAIRIPDFMAVCDASLISLAKNHIFALTLPAKTQSCFACGKPVIVSGDGEINELVKSVNAGVAAGAANHKELAEVIISLCEKPENELKQMGINAREYFVKYFAKDKLLDKMDEYFKK